MSQTQEFEKSLTGSAATVAHFEERRSPLNRLQHVLHGNPALVPLIVLVALIMFFGFAAGERFFRASTLTLVLQQVAVVGILAAAQTLVVLTAGIDLAIGVIMVFSLRRDGQPRRRQRHARGIALLAGFALAAILGLRQRQPRRAAEAAAVHRDARHVERHHGDLPDLFRATRRSDKPT
jgi:fructose transport system permease protein